MTDAETAYAKLNLALHVRARAADGYHRIETLFAFCADGDTVEAVTDGPPLAIDGPLAEGLSAGPDNLVRRAADGIAVLFGVAVPPLRLTKRLPVAAGIGGGSADAAAAIRLIARIHGIPLDDPRVARLAEDLGADVPACLASVAVRGEGRGDQLVPAADDLAGVPVLLLNPRVACPTGPVFAGWDGVDRGPLGLDWRQARNDLESPARALVPAIDAVLAALGRHAGVTLARMSGSGATCFALFDDIEARDRAAGALAATGWWTMATVLR